MFSGRTIGKYFIFEAFASGGMATVHYGVEATTAGRRVVAMKRVTTNVEGSAELSAALASEARIGAHVRHPNVTAALDFVVGEGEVVFVMEYVDGPSLATVASALRARGERLPNDVAITIIVGALRGLQALHTATDERGKPLELVHRDVSPHNILIGKSGIAKISDFGVAKGSLTGPRTTTGQIKGKLRYLSPEQVHGSATPRSDVFAMGITAWEIVAGRRLFSGDSDAETLARILGQRILPPNQAGADVPEAVEKALMIALERDPERRFPSAAAMADALEASTTLVTPEHVANAVGRASGTVVGERAQRIVEILRSVDDHDVTALGVASPPKVSRGRRVSPLWAAALVAPAIAGGWLLLRRPEHQLASPGPERSLATVPIASSSASATSMTTAPPTTTVTTADASAPRVTPPVPALRPTAKPACSPPFVFDAAGRKHFKPECF